LLGHKTDDVAYSLLYTNNFHIMYFKHNEVSTGRW